MLEGVLAGLVAARTVGVAGPDGYPRRGERARRLAAHLDPVESGAGAALATRLDAAAADVDDPRVRRHLRRIAGRAPAVLERAGAGDPEFTDERAAVDRLVADLRADDPFADDPTVAPLDPPAERALRRAVAGTFAEAAATLRERVTTAGGDEGDATGGASRRGKSGTRTASSGSGPSGPASSTGVGSGSGSRSGDSATVAERVEEATGVALADRLGDVAATFERLAGAHPARLYEFPAERAAAVAAVDADRETPFVDRPAVPDRPEVGRHLVVGPPGSGKSRVIAERLARLPADALGHVLVPEADLLDAAAVRALMPVRITGDVLLVWDLHDVAGTGPTDVAATLDRLDATVAAAGHRLYTLLEAPAADPGPHDVDTETDPEAGSHDGSGRAAAAAGTAGTDAGGDDLAGDGPREGTPVDPGRLPGWGRELATAADLEPLWVGRLDEARLSRLAGRTAGRFGVSLDEAAREAVVERAAGSGSAPTYLAAAHGIAGHRLDVDRVRDLAADPVAVWTAEYDRLRTGTSAEWRVLAAMAYLAALRVPRYATLVRAVYTRHLESDGRRFRTAVRSLSDRGWLRVVGEDLVGETTRYRVHASQLRAVAIDPPAADPTAATALSRLLLDRLGEAVPTVVRPAIHRRCSATLAEWGHDEAAAAHWARAVALAPATAETHEPFARSLASRLPATVAADALGYTVDRWLRTADPDRRRRALASLPTFVRRCDGADRPGLAVETCERGLAILRGNATDTDADDDDPTDIDAGGVDATDGPAVTTGPDGPAPSSIGSGGDGTGITEGGTVVHEAPDRTAPRNGLPAGGAGAARASVPVAWQLRTAYATLSARSAAARAPELYWFGLDALRANERGPAAGFLTAAWRLRRTAAGDPPTDALAAGVWAAALRAAEEVPPSVVAPAVSEDALADRPIVAAVAAALFDGAATPIPAVLRERGTAGYYGLERDALTALLST
jgi:hypothetical protein